VQTQQGKEQTLRQTLHKSLCIMHITNISYILFQLINFPELHFCFKTGVTKALIQIGNGIPVDYSEICGKTCSAPYLGKYFKIITWRKQKNLPIKNTTQVARN